MSRATLMTTAPAWHALAVVLAVSLGSAAACGAPAGESRPQIAISPAQARSAGPGPAANFVGQAEVERLLAPLAPSRLSIGRVHFEPGARSNWHTHPVGQALIVTDGLGWVQQWGGPRREIRPGDVVWIPPGVKHWHGA